MPFLIKEGTVTEGSEPETAWLAGAIKTLVERSNTLVELAAKLRYYILDEVEFNEKAMKKFLKAQTKPYLESSLSELTKLDDFSEAAIEGALDRVMQAHEVKLGKVAQPIRVAMTGGTESPGIHEMLSAMGKERVIKKLEAAIAVIPEAE